MKIGILFAMPVEADLFCADYAVTSETTEAGIHFRRASRHGNDIFICVTGVGCVSAAAAAQLLISKYNCSVLLNAGGAGGIGGSLSIGDLVIVKNITYHDFDMKMLQNYPPYVSSFSASPAIAKTASNYCRDNDLPYSSGGVATGNEFVCSSKAADEIAKRTECICVDMECAAIAQIAARNNVPFGSVKVITDLANEAVAEQKYLKDMPYEQFVGIYCGVLNHLVRRLSGKGIV